ncbi:unnamed protein product [Peronospora belbahrii]|uniref:CASP-like protein n=1 Tax=Peronospora belbahrii TaxID=622444 RepID=A0AAU9L1W9_9STRA|nr:unnamed protein product [Peronospora belbahrii]
MKLSIVRNGVRDLLFGGHVTITLQSCFNDSYKYLEINFVYTAGATTVALLSIYLSSLSLLLMSLASKPICSAVNVLCHRYHMIPASSSLDCSTQCYKLDCCQQMLFRSLMSMIWCIMDLLLLTLL